MTMSAKAKEGAAWVGFFVFMLLFVVSGFVYVSGYGSGYKDSASGEENKYKAKYEPMYSSGYYNGYAGSYIRGLEQREEKENGWNNNDAATNIEAIKATKDIQMAFASAYGKAFENANVNIVAGSTQEIMSSGAIGKISVGPKEGVAMQQFFEMNPGLADLIKLKKLVPVKKEVTDK